MSIQYHFYTHSTYNHIHCSSFFTCCTIKFTRDSIQISSIQLRHPNKRSYTPHQVNITAFIQHFLFRFMQTTHLINVENDTTMLMAWPQQAEIVKLLHQV